MCSGREFQVWAVATGKARLPTVASLTGGTTRRLVPAERRREFIILSNGMRSYQQQLVQMFRVKCCTQVGRHVASCTERTFACVLSRGTAET